jgi:hypothetical protein
LRPVEDSLSQAVEHGREAVAALGQKLLFLWLGKIFYGILYKELMLLKDRSDPAHGTIITSEFLKRYRMHRYFLQQARGLVHLKDFNVGTVFVFEAQPLMNERLRWDIVDCLDGLMIGVRVGRVGIIGALGDGGAQENDAEIYEPFFKTPLHPIQFRELCARVAYRAVSATRTPKYLIQGISKGTHVVTSCRLAA